MDRRKFLGVVAGTAAAAALPTVALATEKRTVVAMIQAALDRFRKSYLVGAEGKIIISMNMYGNLLDELDGRFNNNNRGIKFLSYTHRLTSYKIGMHDGEDSYMFIEHTTDRGQYTLEHLT